VYLLDDEQGLPPKYKTTLGKLEVQKRLLSVELSVCIRDWACHNKEHANDYMCAFVCTIYDILREDYSNKITLFHFEKQLGNEAIRHTLSSWLNYNVANPTPDDWRSVLRTALRQHTGKLIWPIQKDVIPRDPVPKMAEPPQIETPKKNTLMPEFAVELERLLIEARFTSEAIANEVGINWRTVYRHRKGEIQPSLKNIGAYEKALSKLLNRRITLPTPARRQNASKKPV
jgi:hypothetical protein